MEEAAAVQSFFSFVAYNFQNPFEWKSEGVENAYYTALHALLSNACNARVSSQRQKSYDVVFLSLVCWGFGYVLENILLICTMISLWFKEREGRNQGFFVSRLKAEISDFIFRLWWNSSTFHHTCKSTAQTPSLSHFLMLKNSNNFSHI